MAATVPAAQASTIAQRKRTASRPATAKAVLTETIVAGQRANLLGLAAIVAGIHGSEAEYVRPPGA
jgi:hypothetical protein